MALLDFGRDTLDQKIQEAGNEFLRATASLAESEVPAILRKIEKDYQIPGSYLFFVLSKRPQDAKKILGSDYNAAQMARQLWISKYTDYDAVGRVRVPPAEFESKFNPALREFGAWAKTKFRKNLVSVFVGVLKQKAREFVREIQEPFTEKDVRVTLYRELPLRAKDHPFWFSDSITLQRLLEIV